MPGTDGETRIRSVTLRGHTFAVADDKPTFWDRAEAGTWEPETLAALEGLVSHGTRVLDVGAWVGPTVLFSAALGASVVAVEADPRALDLLRGNLHANPGLEERVVVVPAAASPWPGRVRLGAARKRGDSMSSALLTSAADVWEAEAVTPADLLARVEGQGPMVVKVDIEGGEYDLLPVLVPALPPECRAILVAFHPVLLRASGVPDATVAERTRACLDALRDYAARVVDMPGDPGSDLLAVACAANVTVLFEQRRA